LILSITDGQPKTERKRRKRSIAVTPTHAVDGTTGPAEVTAAEVTAAEVTPAEVTAAENVRFDMVINDQGSVVSCGQLYGIGVDAPIHMLPASITEKDGTHEASGVLLYDGKPVSHVTLTVPVDSLEKGVPLASLDRPTRKLAKEVSLAAWQDAGKQSGIHARTALRRQYIAILIKKEILSCLKAKAMRRTFTLGLCSLDTDVGILGLVPDRVRYSYKDCNVESLDGLLGKRWDVMHKADGQFAYVTAVRLWVTPLRTINGSVHVGHSRCQFEDGYREIVKRLIATAGLREEEEEEEEEDDEDIHTYL
jgi:hypothetical protein